MEQAKSLKAAKESQDISSVDKQSQTTNIERFDLVGDSREDGPQAHQSVLSISKLYISKSTGIHQPSVDGRIIHDCFTATHTEEDNVPTPLLIPVYSQLV